MEHVAPTTVPLDTGGTRPSEFETTQKFKSKEDLIKWAREVRRLHGFVIITFKSDSGKANKANKNARVILACEGSGKCDSRSTSTKGIEGKSKRRHAETKKCDCPFRLRGKKLEVGDEWELMVVQEMHNHLLHDTGKLGHSFQGRLSQEEKLLLKDLCVKGEQPKKILRALQERDEHNKSSPRTIYNERQSLKRRLTLEEESIQDIQYVNCGLQQLMSKAEEYNYIVKHRIRPKTDTVLDLFVTHPTCLELLLAFPTLLLIEFAEFGNPKRVVTLGIYGYTSAGACFDVGLAILSSSNRISSYEWALTSLRGGEEDDYFGLFAKHWKLLVKSRSEADVKRNLKLLSKSFVMCRDGLHYVENTLLKSPYKQMFVAALRVLDDDIYSWFHEDMTEFLQNGEDSVVKQTEIDEFWEGQHNDCEEQYSQIKAYLVKSLTCEEQRWLARRPRV